jgi:hypothetical protein
MNKNYAQPAVQICADVHYFFVLIRRGVTLRRDVTGRDINWDGDDVET